MRFVAHELAHWGHNRIGTTGGGQGTTHGPKKRHRPSRQVAPAGWRPNGLVAPTAAMWRFRLRERTVRYHGHHRGEAHPGELLVEAGVLSQSQLEQALFARRKDGRKLETASHRARVGERDSASHQTSRASSAFLGCSLYHVDFSRSLLNLVPREIAEKYLLVPIFVRRVRKQGETLYVAMEDPTNDTGIDEVARCLARRQTDDRLPQRHSGRRFACITSAKQPPPPVVTITPAVLSATAPSAVRPERSEALAAERT